MSTVCSFIIIIFRLCRCWYKDIPWSTTLQKRYLFLSQHMKHFGLLNVWRVVVVVVVAAQVPPTINYLKAKAIVKTNAEPIFPNAFQHHQPYWLLLGKWTSYGEWEVCDACVCVCMCAWVSGWVSDTQYIGMSIENLIIASMHVLRMWMFLASK